MAKRLLGLLLCISSAQAMVFDNRYLPLLLKPFSRREDTCSHLRFQPFFMQADRAFEDAFELELPDLITPYDQRVLERSMVTVGFPPFLRSELQGRTSILWGRKGRLDAQGLAFLYEREILPWLSIGANGLFIHVANRHEFLLRGPDESIPDGNKEYLSTLKEKMHEELGVCAPLFSEVGFGDLDLYLRVASQWDYCFRFRHIDAGVRFGVIAPTSKQRDIHNPAAIPFGGNNHWGLYGQLEGEVELREDLSVGLWFRAQKRLRKTQCLRMPLCIGNGAVSEPPEYGTLIGPVDCDPGFTLVFTPYVELAHLRRGLGVRAIYSMIYHASDRLYDKRPVKEFSSNLALLESASSWGSEFVSIGAFYDVGLVREHWYPKVSLYWDIPVDWLVAKRAARTNSVSLMFEMDF